MAEEEHVPALVVQWVPLLTMDLVWEASWRQTVHMINSPAAPVREYNQNTQQETHIHFLAYEARWHKKVKKEGCIESALLNFPPSKQSRIVLVACDNVAYPNIVEKNVQSLSNDALSNIGKQRHIIRAYTTDVLRSDTEDLLLQSLMERGMISLDYGDSSSLDMQYLAPQSEGLEKWDARGI